MSRLDERLALGLAAVLLLVGAAALVWRWPELSYTFGRGTTLGSALGAVPRPDGRPSADHSGRLVYAYSVVPGGVADADEVRRAAEADPVVAEHYRDLNLGRLKTISLKADTAAYVSFRKGGKIYWTTKKVRLAKGETVLSDGANLVRARCGNRISDAAMPRSVPDEPPEAELDTPILPGGPMAPLQLPGPPEQGQLLAAALPPQLPEPPPPLPEVPEQITLSAPSDGTNIAQEESRPPWPFINGIPWSWAFLATGPTPIIVVVPPKEPGDHGGGGGTTVTTTDTPPEALAPEPSSMLLIGAGLIGLGGVLTLARRQRKS